MCIILKVKGPVVIVLTGRQPLARLLFIYIRCLPLEHEVLDSVVGCCGYRGEGDPRSSPPRASFWRRFIFYLTAIEVAAKVKG